MQGVSKTDFENYVKANDAVLRNMQNQGQGLQNQMTNLTEMLSKFITSNTASSSNSGTLPSQTVTNPREHLNLITTRSGKTCEGPSTPLIPTPVVSTPLKEPEQNPETSMDKVQKPSLESTAQVPPLEVHDSIFIEILKPKAKKTVLEPNSPRPNSYQPKLPYPERMKVRENDKPSAQHSRFLKMFKQLRLEIGLKDALVKMSKFNKWLSGLLRNKEKLEEIVITTVNAECSAIIMNKVPGKLKDPGKFPIPCALQELDRTNALANSGASINLLPHSIYKQLGLGDLTPTRMTLELANRSITHPMGIVFSANHDMCVDTYLHSVNASPNVKNDVPYAKQVWKPKQVTQVVQIVLWYLDSGCSKHMTGDRSRLMNFVKKFIGTVRFGNDHFGAIMGYGDYVIGDSVISKVYYVEGLGHNLFFVGQFCDSDLEVAFRKHSCYVRDTDGVELLKGIPCSKFYTLSLLIHDKSSPIMLS
ncbi:reverse transcriptase domain-containing protein [Tanacetum coccineum]|uniref:Reverse transcriptase domain-containing protein n=1 Tax=Tanacetum coccineum TaxID=301880 RepID=A0ABQ4WR16_9ASTR